MDKKFDYNILLSQAFQEIRNIRDPQSINQEYVQHGKSAIDNERIMTIGGLEFDNYKAMVEQANAISEECLNSIILHLLKYYEITLEKVNIDNLKPEICFAYYDKQDSCVYFFKKPAKDLAWTLRGRVPEGIQEVLKKYSARDYKYIYLLYDKAQDQIFGGNKDTELFCSIQWFFNKYFGQEEYEAFHRCFVNYMNMANKYLGFTVVKTLNASAHVNFRHIVMNRLLHFDYSKLCDIKMNDRELSDEQYEMLRKQYMEDYLYLIMLGSTDFSESFITAEWLYSSMRDAAAIDLTVIGMGFLKSVEQLIYAIIVLHKNAGLTIKAKNSKDYIEINTKNIEAESIDTTIGSMANFFKINLKNPEQPQVLREDLPYSVRKYIIEAMFTFKDIRNGYFHKQNIHDWAVIDKIRSTTYNLIFLLLGSASLRETDKTELGFPQENFFSDLYRLCEYINYHAGDIFYLCFDETHECIAKAQRDNAAYPVNGIYYHYSGVYFTPLEQSKDIDFTHMPKQIYLGSLGIQECEEVKLEPKKVLKIYSEGKFVGPSIWEESGIHY